MRKSIDETVFSSLALLVPTLVLISLAQVLPIALVLEGTLLAISGRVLQGASCVFIGVGLEAFVFLQCEKSLKIMGGIPL